MSKYCYSTHDKSLRHICRRVEQSLLSFWQTVDKLLAQLYFEEPFSSLHIGKTGHVAVNYIYIFPKETRFGAAATRTRCYLSIMYMLAFNIGSLLKWRIVNNITPVHRHGKCQFLTEVSVFCIKPSSCWMDTYEYIYMLQLSMLWKLRLCYLASIIKGQRSLMMGQCLLQARWSEAKPVQTQCGLSSESFKSLYVQQSNDTRFRPPGFRRPRCVTSNLITD